MINKKDLKIKIEDLSCSDDSNPTFYKDTMNLKQNISKKINFNKIIEKKKKEIKNLVKKKLGNTEFYRNQRKPKNSDLLFHFPKIRKKIWHERRKQINDLNEKIEVGSLLYLHLKNNKNNNNQEQYLKRSSIFKFENHEDTIEEEYQKIVNKKKRNSHFYKSFSPKRKDTSNVFYNLTNNTINYSNTKNTTIENNNNSSTNLNSINYKNSRNKPNLFKLTNFKLMTPINKKNIRFYLTNSESNTQENNESNNKTIDNFTTSKLSKTTNSFFSPFQIKKKIKNDKIHTKIRSNIIEKVTKLNDLTNDCNDQLFKLVDSSKNKERESSKLKDLQEIFSFKINKNKDTTKKLVHQAKNDIYFKMEQKKADLLYLSDEITKMPDDVALHFVDRIAKYYVNQSNLVEEVNNIYKLNFGNKNNNKYFRELRKKIKKNYDKIIKMDINLDKRKEEMYVLHDNIFNKGK